MSALAVAAGPDDRELDDLDLVAAVRAGDDRAFEALFLRYQPRIAAYVGGMVRDHGRAEDITQEVFMAALRRLRTGDEREILFRPWIYEIAKNKCIDAYRRGRNTTEVSFDADDQIGAADQGRLAAPGATPDAAVEGKVAFDNLRGAFGGLSPVHHEILVMREFEGLSYREIGDRLGMSRPAVESTLFRARKRLGEEYEELVSGKRCLRVQAIVDDSSERAAGLRDQRRVARHLAHCQPCRRYAHLAGADLDLLRRPSVAARVAAFLPLPAFLRRRLGGSEEATQMLGQQAARPAVQWSAHLAGSLDPGAVSTWAKAAATAATVALAGVGGSAIEHHGAAAAAPAAAGAGAAVLPHGGAPGPAQGAEAAGAGTGQGGAAPASAGDASPAAGEPGAAGLLATGGADQPSGSSTAADPHGPAPGGAASPLTVDGSADTTLAPVTGAVGDTAGGRQRPAGGGDDGSAGPSSKLGGVTTPIVPSHAAAPAGAVVPHGGADRVPSTDKLKGADKLKGPDEVKGGDTPAAADAPIAAPEVPAAELVGPGRSADAPGHDVADANRSAHAAEPHGSPPNGRGKGLAKPRASESVAGPTAAPSLGG